MPTIMASLSNFSVQHILLFFGFVKDVTPCSCTKILISRDLLYSLFTQTAFFKRNA